MPPRGYGSRLLAVLLTVGVMSLLAASPAAAYEKLGHRWAGNTVTYYNAAKKLDRGVRMGIRAWNRSKIRIRFVRVRRSRARLVIRYAPWRHCVGHARVPLGVRTISSSVVMLPRPRRGNAFCVNRFQTALTTAHEVGHVLGLWHEKRRCAVMNASGGYLGDRQCNGYRRMFDTPWLWRCRILEPDDLRGAKSIYGGSARAARKALCPTYARQKAPGDLQVTAVALPGDETQTVTARFTRPRDPRIPKFVRNTQRGVKGGFNVRVTRDRCETKSGSYPENEWTVAPGKTQRYELPSGLAPGRYCVTVRGVDRVTRPGKLAKTFVTVTAPPPVEPF